MKAGGRVRFEDRCVAQAVETHALCKLHEGRLAHPSRFFLPVPELRVPRSCVLCKGGYDAACRMCFIMPSGLHRSYGDASPALYHLFVLPTIAFSPHGDA